MRTIASALLLLTGTIAPVRAQAPVPLDTLRVQAGSRLVAGAAAVTRAVDVLDRAAIEALPARTVSDVVARGLGVDLLARSPAQADVSIRGGSFEQVLVLVDGVPMNDDQTGHFHLDVAVPLDAIERVELLRGPAAAIYGSSAVGGVINIVTRRSTQELTGRIQGGSFGAYSLALEGGRRFSETAGLRLGAEHDAADGHRAGTEHRTTQARLAFDAGLGGGTLRGDVGLAMRDFGAADFYAPYDSREETRTGTASLGWSGRPGAFVLAPRLSYRQHRDDFILLRDDPAFYRNRHTTHQAAGEIVARWTPRPALRLAWGGEARRSSIESNSLGHRDETSGALFAEAAAGTVDRLLLALGMRIDHHSTFGTFASPSASTAYRVSDALRLRASAATGFRAPSWTDRYYEDPANVGNPDLQPERFWTAELGSALALGAVRLDLAVFMRHARDLIDWGRPEGSDPAAEPWVTLNVEEATFRGLELGVGTALGVVSLTGRASLLDFEAEERPGFVSKYALQPLTRAASLEAAAPVGRHIRTALRAATFRRADGERWELVDARVSVRPGRAEIFFDVTNLLDQRYLDVSARPAPGRAFSAGLRLRR